MRPSPRPTPPLSAVAALLVLPAVAGAKEAAWRHDSAQAFRAGERERVVVSDSGVVSLARPIGRFGELNAERVWSLARASDGSIYAATGDQGRVFRRRGDAEWEEVYDAEDSQALSLAAAPDGRVFLGTGPGGQVVELTHADRPASRPGPEVRYVWGLAFAPDGSLLAATGPDGQLWRRPPDGGAWELLLDSPQRHLLCVVADREGAAYAGSDGEGLLYRVAPDGRASVLFDAPQDEIHALAIGPDGRLHAGTASGGGGPDTPANRPSATGALDHDDDDDEPTARPASARVRARSPFRLAQDRPSPGGTARLRPGAAGENVVYRIEPDGSAREIFRARALVYALAWQDDRLLVGTGPDGRLFEVRDDGRDAAEIARVDHGQVLALLPGAGGATLLGVGDPGGVLRLEPGHDATGTLTSAVLDAKLLSRFGSLVCRAARPEGTSVSLQLRTGNVGRPDATWSDWSEPASSPEPARPDVPPGRFAQYRVTLATDDPARSPELRAVALYYRTRNLPPEVARLTVPDVSSADGAARRTRLDLKWEAEDPNGDDLVYRLAIRKDDWPDWVELNLAAPLTETSYSWDATSVPAGVYRVRVVASDRPSNPSGEALTGTRTSEPLVIDHQAPAVTVEVAGDGRDVRVTLRDDLTRLVKAEYSLDGGPWTAVFPDDGLFDAIEETLAFRLPEPGPGPHVVVVRATDAAGNVGSGDAVLRPR